MTDILDTAAAEEQLILHQAFLESERKRKRLKIIIIGTLSVLTFLIWFFLQPLRAGPEYGLCRTFLETNIRYPTTFKITQYDEFGGSLRIFYTYHDEWGGHRSEMIECIATLDPMNGYIMDAININRQPIDRNKLKLFNAAIPGILASGPNLIIPSPPRNDLQSLKRD